MSIRSTEDFIQIGILTNISAIDSFIAIKNNQLFVNPSNKWTNINTSRHFSSHTIKNKRFF